MIETKTSQTGGGELSRCQDRAWASKEDEKRFGIEKLPNTDRITKEAADKEGLNMLRSKYKGLIHIGQRVFTPDNNMIGLVTKLFLNAQGNLSHLSIRTARLFGQHKLAPIADVRNATPLRVELSIDKKHFKELPDYQSDSSIRDAMDHAMWKDGVLRNTDYHNIDVQVRDGVISLNGYVSQANQWRVNNAAKDISGSLGLKSHLIVDDKLLLQVASALTSIERGEGNHVFAKVNNGVVELSGKVVSTNARDLAQQYTGELSWVRGVINNITVPGVGLPSVDQRFLQPLIGQTIYFRDGLYGIVQKVIIHRDTRRVIAIVLRGRFPEAYHKSGRNLDLITPEQLAVIPIHLVRYLTANSGFLLIDSSETTQYKDFDPKNVVSPEEGWVPPYPYCNEHVLFLKNSHLE